MNDIDFSKKHYVRVVRIDFTSEDFKNLDDNGVPIEAHKYARENEAPLYAQSLETNHYRCNVWFGRTDGKTCTACLVFKPRSDFYPSRKYGLRGGRVLKNIKSKCKDCTKESFARYKKPTPEANGCKWCGNKRHALVDEDFCTERCKSIYYSVRFDTPPVKEEKTKTYNDYVKEAQANNQRLLEKYR